MSQSQLFAADKICSFCGNSKFVLASDGSHKWGALKADKGRKVLKCVGCGSHKVNGSFDDELHSQYHTNGKDPQSDTFEFKGKVSA